MADERVIVLAEDDEDDYLLSVEALQRVDPAMTLVRVRDGEQLLDHLRGGSSHGGGVTSHAGAVVMLDLNMPKIDGRQALRAIKSDPELRRLPTVVFTTSQAREDIERAYDCGVNSYIRKPDSFDGFVGVMKEICAYWFSTVELPL